jgi:hypothetical protein
MEEEAQPQILFAGNAELLLQIEKTLGREARLRVVGNVRPALDMENLGPTEAGVERLYQDKLSSLPGFDKLKAWSQTPILPTAKALSYVIRYLARLQDLEDGILGVDIGSSAITVVASLGEDFTMTVCSDLAVPLLSSPFWGVREGDRLDHAVICEALRSSLARARINWPYADPLIAFKTIVASGGVLSHAPDPSDAALIILDALQPVGVSTLLLDANQLLAPLGALAAIHPLAAAQILDSGGLITLGTVIAPVGRAREDETALRINRRFEGGEEQETETPYGSLQVLPIPLGEMATLELKPARGFDVGWGRGKKSPPIKVSGGTIGLIIDARGRPLVLPEAKDERQAKIQQWH